MIKDQTNIQLYKTAILILFSLLLIGCTARSNVVLPSTGTPMTAEWKDYNAQAEVNGAPLLKYVVTAKRVLKGPTRPHEIQDVFSTRDTRVTVFTKWRNISGKPMYKIKIFDPREVLFHARSLTYRYQSGIWNIWDDVFIKGWAASRLPGLWRADIYMDDILVTKKNFIIGSQDKNYAEKIDDENMLKIGVIPFADHKLSNRTHGYSISLYLAQMLSIDLDHSTIVMPFKLRNDFIKPYVIYDEYKDFLTKEINSPRKIYVKKDVAKTIHNSTANFNWSVEPPLIKNRLLTQAMAPNNTKQHKNISKFSALIFHPIHWRNHSKAFNGSHIKIDVNTAEIQYKIDTKATLGRNSENDA